MDYLEKRFDVSVTRNIPFGEARIGFNDGKGPMSMRTLAMDMYSPIGCDGLRLPALIMAFGGAFHRGSKEDDTVRENEVFNTPIAEYCLRFAARGYRCFSIDYRLTQEDPDPGEDRVLGDGDVPRGRIDYVRNILGLAPSTAAMIRNEQEAAINDMAMAWRHVADAADTYGVDPVRIAVGGFSAGARIAMISALVKGIRPAAAIGLSGYVPDIVIDNFRKREAPSFPMFVCRGENDLDYVVADTPKMCAMLAEAGLTLQTCVVPGAGHFYPCESPAVSPDGETKDLESAMAEFLKRALWANHNEVAEA